MIGIIDCGIRLVPFTLNQVYLYKYYNIILSFYFKLKYKYYIL